MTHVAKSKCFISTRAERGRKKKRETESPILARYATERNGNFIYILMGSNYCLFNPVFGSLSLSLSEVRRVSISQAAILKAILRRDAAVRRRFTMFSWLKTRTEIDRVIGAVHAARHYAIYSNRSAQCYGKWVWSVGRLMGRSGRRRPMFIHDAWRLAESPLRSELINLLARPDKCLPAISIESRNVNVSSTEKNNATPRGTSRRRFQLTDTPISSNASSTNKMKI